jgi:DNA-binding IclR family transcriptional regulator
VAPSTTQDISSTRDDRAAVDKAMSVLVAFGADASTGVGVSELARRAALPKSTTHRVLGTLERNGVVEKVGQLYRLGARLAELGRSVYAHDHDRIRDAMIPFLADLWEATHETVHLAALHGTDVLYLSKVYGHRQLKMPSRTGARLPAYATAVGKALLAHDPEALELTLARRLVPYTTRTVRHADALLAQLAEVREDGLAREDEEVVPGLSCIAVPVFGATGRPLAALSISVPISRIDPQVFEPVLRRAGAAASQLMCRQRPAAARRYSA